MLHLHTYNAVNSLAVSGLRRLQFGIRCCSTRPKDDQHVVMKLRSMVACWHPEPKFPYEHSKPIPRLESSTVVGDCNSKIKPVRCADANGPSTQELNNMFYVTKHVWRHRPQLNRAKTDTPQERKAL